jgi:hypothetical protein
LSRDADKVIGDLLLAKQFLECARVRASEKPVTATPCP